MGHSAAAPERGRPPERTRAAVAAGLTALRRRRSRGLPGARHGGTCGGHGPFGAGPERSGLLGPLVLSEQRPNALRARNAGAVPGPQQDARIPGPQRQGALGGLELRRASPGLGVLRQDGQRLLAGEGPVGELSGPGPGQGRGAVEER